MIFYAIPTAYCIPFFTRNVQPFILQRQPDTLSAAKEWKGEVEGRAQCNTPINVKKTKTKTKKHIELITKKVTCYVNIFKY